MNLNKLGTRPPQYINNITKRGEKKVCLKKKYLPKTHILNHLFFLINSRDSFFRLKKTPSNRRFKETKNVAATFSCFFYYYFRTRQFPNKTVAKCYLFTFTVPVIECRVNGGTYFVFFFFFVAFAQINYFRTIVIWNGCKDK